MPSKREQIIDKVRELLLNETPAGFAVFRERRRPLGENDLRAINIVPESDPRQDTGGTQFTDRFLTLDIQIHARGEQPSTVADSTVIAVHVALMANRTLDGLALDVVANDNDFEYDELDDDLVCIHQRYAVLYRTQETDLTQ
jgi:hypothetical protein